MVNWSSAAELARDSQAFNNLMHVLVGLYIWEFSISFPFDWNFISGKRVFRWPLIFYFGGRYCLLFALIGVLVTLEVTGEVNCQALYIFNEVMGNASIGFASINLSIRTMAIWSQNKWIVIPLCLIILGHWSFLMQGVLLRAKWVPGEGCVITQTRSQLLAITFVYSMVLDLIVMCLTAYKLYFRVEVRSRIMNLIFQDGLIYFFVAFLANMIATVFMLLNLNPVMSIIFNVPAAIASTIVASRAVRRLMKFAYRSREQFTVTGDGTNIKVDFRRNSAAAGPVVTTIGSPSKRVKNLAHNGDRHIQLDTFIPVFAVHDNPDNASYQDEYELRDRANFKPHDLEDQNSPDDSGHSSLKHSSMSSTTIAECPVKHAGLVV